MFIFLSCLVVFLSLFGNNNGEEKYHLYHQFVTPGMIYNITNPGYPNLYSAGSVYGWTMESNSPMRLTCDPFNVPFSQQCKLDRLMVQDGRNGIYSSYCGGRRFSILSKFNKLTVRFATGPFSPGGSFSCTIETEQPQCECGKRNSARIVGGNETGVNEYPMMAAVVDYPTSMIFCGATIINVKQVLTAAHCVFGRAIGETKILVGDHNVLTVTDTSASRLHLIDSFLIHEDYNRISHDYDIAIVRVTGTIEFNQYVSAVCLPFQRRYDKYLGNYVDVLGWGASSISDMPSNFLMKASLTVVDEYQCKLQYPNSSDRQMCTQEPGKDSCHCDSGGPLLWQSPVTRRVIQVGIISLGTACSVSNMHPSLNTRVGRLLDWIEANNAGYEYCKVE